MRPRSTVWRIAAALFIIVNLAGAGMAIARGEAIHAAVHAALVLAGYFVWRLSSRRVATH
ncbi:MAG TPA: hypothetical protein VJU87_11845 [Gemmatimonadaceae bacterium]|nr:hypothetical protein [Gemmatimonadaceae bacterium]